MGLFKTLTFERLKEGLSKTRMNIFGKLQRIITTKAKIDDELLEQVEEILIGGDVGVRITATIIQNLKERVKRDSYQDSSQLYFLLKDEIEKLLMTDGINQNNRESNAVAQCKPYIIMVVGVNGVGKTTTIGKLAYYFSEAGKKVLVAAADTFRAAASEQLEIWAKRAGVPMIRQAYGADPAAVVFDALKSAVAQDVDVLIIDTAGRLHTKVNLMDELKKIRRVLQKQVPSAPHEVLLVLDATTGQNAVQQTKQFKDAVGVTGLVLTKLDGTAKGGIILSINNEMKIPVKYIGVGETIEDLQPFDSKAFVHALFSGVAEVK